MTDYRSLLQVEFTGRRDRNAGYSKRAFARDIGVSPGHLVSVLAGKKKLSPDKASSIVSRVEWPKARKKLFLDLVRLENARNDSHRAIIQSDLKRTPQGRSYRKLKLETFQIISNWYYHALLLLSELMTYQYDPKWISKKLGLNLETVKSAITVLENLDLIDRTSGPLKI